jgi:hypothetical protein
VDSTSLKKGKDIEISLEIAKIADKLLAKLDNAYL